MQSPVYASKAIRITPHSCVDVHADDNAVVLGYVGDRVSVEIHAAPKYARMIADALTEGAAKSLAAREAK